MDNNAQKDNITMPSISTQSAQGAISSKTSSGNSHDQIIELLQANLEISKELLEINKKFQRFFAFQKFWVALKILLIAIPLILGAIYLPPLLQSLVSQYQSLFNLNAAVGEIDTSAIQNLLNQYGN